MPDIIQWYMERIFPIERRVMGALRPVAKRLTSLPLPDEGVYSAVKRFYDRLEGVRKVLIDAETTSIRLVVNPEKMVIAEAMRTFTYLNLFGYRVDAVVANRLLPDEVSDPYFDRWKELQKAHLATIHEAFEPVPVLTARLHEQELLGPELLESLGDEIYADLDASKVLFVDEPMSIVKSDDRYVLTLRLSFARKEDLELSTKADELFVKIGPYRRTIMLPKMLAAREIASAALKEDRLEIVFERRSNGTR